MSAPQQRRTVLHLYRSILRIGRTWEGPAEEKTYIFDEARRQFRQNQHVNDNKQVTELVREGEARLEYATHYKIPYPRLEHASQFSRQYFMQAPRSKPAGPQKSSRPPTNKLEEAAERLNAKKRQQSSEPTD